MQAVYLPRLWGRTLRLVRALYPNVVSTRRAHVHVCMSRDWVEMDFTEKFYTLVCQLKSGPELPENSMLY